MRNWEICDAEGRAGTPTPMRTSTAHARDEVERRPLRVSAADADGGRERSGRHPTTASLPRRLFQCGTRSELASSSAPSSVRTLHFCWSIDSETLARSARNAQKNRGPEDANKQKMRNSSSKKIPPPHSGTPQRGGIFGVLNRECSRYRLTSRTRHVSRRRDRASVADRRETQPRSQRTGVVMQNQQHAQMQMT